MGVRKRKRMNSKEVIELRLGEKGEIDQERGKQEIKSLLKWTG